MQLSNCFITKYESRKIFKQLLKLALAVGHLFCGSVLLGENLEQCTIKTDRYGMLKGTFKKLTLWMTEEPFQTVFFLDNS